MKIYSQKTVQCLVFAVLICLFGYMSAYGLSNFCHDDATNKFTFHVERAIDIWCDGDVPLGAICPGCKKEWICGVNAPGLIFHATGALNCRFIMTYVPWQQLPHIILDFFMYYWDGTQWQPYYNTGNPDSFFDLDHDGIGDYKWGAFIGLWETYCDTPAGNYSRELTVKIEYTCQ